MPLDSTTTIPNCLHPTPTASVQVFITHPGRGDLVIDLIAPDGSSHRVKNSDPTDTAPNVNQIFPVSLRGVTLTFGPQRWTLRVTDVATGSTGSLTGWALVV
jgi:subtilisin-like proprotein convertase family protein